MNIEKMKEIIKGLRQIREDEREKIPLSQQKSIYRAELTITNLVYRKEENEKRDKS